VSIFNSTKKKGPKVLFLTTEQKPFCHVGGLGTVMQALPEAMSKLGVDARVFMPKYLSVEEHYNNLKMVYKGLLVPTKNESGEEFLECNVKIYEAGDEEGKPNTTYFLENREYYEIRANPYGYADDTIRWALLCKGALEFLIVSDWVPDIIVCTDWAAGYFPNYLKTDYKNVKKLSKLLTVFSIHNLAHQGMFKQKFVAEMDYDAGQAPMPGFDDPRINFMNGMRRGIMYSDMINTVSPTYAEEIVAHREMGEELSDLLSERRSVLKGILNGIDYKSWDPTTDPDLSVNFDSKSLGKRNLNKSALQSRFGLVEDEKYFLIGIVSRLSEQKGFSLLEESIRNLLQELPIQVVIVGEGDSRYMNFFQKLVEDFPHQVAFQFKFEKILPRQVFAGADSILIPSKYEPCGLTQMEAMRYGSVPVVRKVGGLSDTVIDLAKDEDANGFVFEKFDPFSLSIAIVRAYENFRNPSIWRKLQENGMKYDSSWDSSAKEYQKMFDQMIKRADRDDELE